MVFSASEARKIADRLIKSSRADSCTVSIEGAEDTYLRFAQNSATTNGSHSLVRMTIESHIGGRSGSVDIARLGRRAIEKASQAQAPIELDPGRYMAILESAAVADLLLQLLWVMEARAADEGRSFFSKKGGGSKLGEKLFDETVTIYSDPNDPIAPDPAFGEDGFPQRRTIWVENGVVKTLCYSRFWAEKMERHPVPKPRSLVMAGGSSSIEEMIRDVKRGVLVTRLWYVNFVDLRTLLLTGLTRDGNFLIENGRIAGPMRNFRFNESLASVLGNIAAIGPSERSHGGLFGDAVISTPPLLVKEFTFSSKAAGI